MKFKVKAVGALTAAVLGMGSLAAVPAVAHPGSTGHAAKAYGRYCKTESRKHIKGEKGTPFSQCVTAMAKLAKGTTKSPAKACKAESRKHIKGERGTPYSQCVTGGKQLLAKKTHTKKH